MTDDELTLGVIAERLNTIRILAEADRDALRRGFEDVQRQFDRFRDVPVRLENLSGRLDAMEQRLEDVEDVGTRGVEWRRASLPIIFLTLALVLTGVGSILTQVH